MYNNNNRVNETLMLCIAPKQVQQRTIHDHSRNVKGRGGPKKG